MCKTASINRGGWYHLLVSHLNLQMAKDSLENTTLLNVVFKKITYFNPDQVTWFVRQKDETINEFENNLPFLIR